MTFIRMRLEARAAVAATVGALVLASAAAGGAPGKWSTLASGPGIGGAAQELGLARTPDGILHVAWKESTGASRAAIRTRAITATGSIGPVTTAVANLPFLPIPRSSRPTAACVSSSPPEPDRRSRVLPAPRDRSPVDPGRFRRESSRRGRCQGRPAWRRRPTAPRSRRGPARRSRFTAGSTVRRRRCSPLPAAARTHARTSLPIRPDRCGWSGAASGAQARRERLLSESTPLRARRRGLRSSSRARARSTRGSRTRRVCWTPQ